MREILLATGNPGKAGEMQQILTGGGRLRESVRWRLLSEFPDWPEPVENGDTFAANAEIKARHYARLSGLWTIADDSGLEVDALGGEPGVRSARFAGDPRDDRRNNALLIERLADVPDDQRTARFRCHVVLADDDHVLASAAGTFEGRIIDRPRGRNGFGYDPHFFVPSQGRTAAEMDPDLKNRLSHRGEALRNLSLELQSFLANATMEPGR